MCSNSILDLLSWVIVASRDVFFYLCVLGFTSSYVVAMHVASLIVLMVIFFC